MEKTIALARALGDGNRMRVVAALMRHDELCVCQITALLGLATPTVSRHMSVLNGVGLVQSRKDGRWVYYRLSDAFPGTLRAWLDESLERSPVVDADSTALRQVLACDAVVLCRSQRASKSVVR
jgi:ArsR family transcriptional regulator